MAGIELYASRSERHRRTWTWAVIVLGLVFAILAPLLAMSPYIVKMFAAGMAAGASGGAVPKPDPALLDPPVTVLIISYILNVAFIFLWVKFFERRGLDTIGFNARGLLRFGRGYLWGCTFLATVVGGIWLCGGYQIQSAGFWSAPTLAAVLPILLYMIMFIIQGSSEEIWMRGWLMGLVSSRHGILWGVAINSVVFGLLHAGNIKPSPEMVAGVVNVALFGVFISLYALNERSLWGVCGWHGAWNWLLGIGFGLEVSGMKLKVAPLVVDLMDKPGAPWWLSGGSWGPEASILTTVVLSGGIAWLVWKGALKQGQGYAAPQKLAETAV
jgi:uncharacterized protein